MLEAWGVNTLIICGAWTDDCVTTTAFDAADKYGYDVILVSNALCTATVNGDAGADVLYISCCLRMTAEEVVDHLKRHPNLIEAPKAPLNGNVRFNRTPYRHDPVLDEVVALKKRIAELEAQLAAK